MTLCHYPTTALNRISQTIGGFYARPFSAGNGSGVETMLDQH